MKTSRKRYVRNKDIQQKLSISAKTVRRWAEQFKWETFKINERVVRFNADDVEKTLGVTFEA
jgi:uncharacterized protein YjcR